MLVAEEKSDPERLDAKSIRCEGNCDDPKRPERNANETLEARTTPVTGKTHDSRIAGRTQQQPNVLLSQPRAALLTGPELGSALMANRVSVATSESSDEPAARISASIQLLLLHSIPCHFPLAKWRFAGKFVALAPP